MKRSEFTYAPPNDPENEIGVWTWDRKIPSPVGSLAVEFQDFPARDDCPNEEMLALAIDLVRFAEANGSLILDILFGAYLAAQRDDPRNLELCGAPKNLTKAEIKSQVRDDLSLVVSRFEDELSASIYLVPFWDEEHALTLEVRDGMIVTINEYSFVLKDGVLELF